MKNHTLSEAKKTLESAREGGRAKSLESNRIRNEWIDTYKSLVAEPKYKKYSLSALSKIIAKRTHYKKSETIRKFLTNYRKKLG